MLARQLQEDCDTLRDKGDAFEAQAIRARANRAAECDAGMALLNRQKVLLLHDVT